MLLLVACAGGASPGERELAFQIVAEGPRAGVPVDSPGIVVGTDAAARARVEQIAGGPLGGDLLVAVLMGQRPTGGYAVRIERMRLRGDTVEVVAAFHAPPPDAVVIQVLTSPFVIAAVARADLPAGTVRFILRDTSGQEIARTEGQLR